MIGYSQDLNPEQLAGRFRSARVAKAVRDDFFGKAESAADARERVKLFHEGIQAVAPRFASLEQHGNDALLAFYPEHIKEILASAEVAVKPIQSIYIERAKARDAWLMAQASGDKRREKLREFVSANDYRGGINYIDSILSQVDAGEYWNLQVARHDYLAADGKHEEAIAYGRSLLKAEDVPERARESILDQEAQSLALLGRNSEAFAQYDQRIEESAADSKKKLRLMYKKAGLVRQFGSTPEAIRAWTAYRDSAEPRTFDWLTGTAFLARALQKSGEHREALQLFDQILATLEAAKSGEIELAWPWSPEESGPFIMLDAAECHIALGESSDAKTKIDRASAGIDALSKSPRQEDKERVDELQEKVATLQAKLDSDKRVRMN
jgi:hypothetical protein